MTHPAETGSANPGTRTISAGRPSLQAPHVYLRAVEPRDYEILRRAETSSDMAATWRLHGAMPSPDAWVQGFWSGVLSHFLIISRREDRPIGLATIYNADHRNGHAYFAAASLAGSEFSPSVVIGIALTIEYVFGCWDFKKLYVEVAEYNQVQFASGIGKWLQPEGRLRDHLVLGGRRWDSLIFAIYQERWASDAPVSIQALRQSSARTLRVRMPPNT